jgi:hypothetical protein
MSKASVPQGYAILLKEIKDRVAQAQMRAVLSVNAELVRLYWDIGRMIDARQKEEGWGTAVIPRLARELKNELPQDKGFSERNIKRMLAFYRAYPDRSSVVPPIAAQLPPTASLLESDRKPPANRKVPQAAAQFRDSILWAIPWFHHVVLMEKVKNKATRLWYMEQTLANGWSRNVLLLMVKSAAHQRQGKALANFDRLLPAPQSDLVRQALKDPYIFDFLRPRSRSTSESWRRACSINSNDSCSSSGRGSRSSAASSRWRSATATFISTYCSIT